MNPETETHEDEYCDGQHTIHEHVTYHFGPITILFMGFSLIFVLYAVDRWITRILLAGIGGQ